MKTIKLLLLCCFIIILSGCSCCDHEWKILETIYNDPNDPEYRFLSCFGVTEILEECVHCERRIYTTVEGKL